MKINFKQSSLINNAEPVEEFGVIEDIEPIEEITIFDAIINFLDGNADDYDVDISAIKPPTTEDDIVEYLLEEGISSFDLAQAISKVENIPLYELSKESDILVLTDEEVVVKNDVSYMLNPFSIKKTRSLRAKKDDGFIRCTSLGVISKEQYELEKENNKDILLEEILKISKTDESQEEAKAEFTNIMLDAIREKASDIHVNPGHDDTANIYFRINGSLERKYYENIKITNGIYMALIYIIHYEAGKDYIETVPQSAKFVFPLGFRNIYLRMEAIPTKIGIDVYPKVTIRILGLDTNLMKIENLGFSSNDVIRFKACVSNDNGIVIVTGPTGSGKSTTLYSLLNYIKKKFPEKSIFTVEDPVEMGIERTTQIEVNEKAGMTFNVALRSILRLDPDIVMVGEIRDLETAQMAIRASLTGHLVLTTLHTNSALGAISRLLDLGVEKALLSDSLAGLTAQRLVKKVCSSCSVPIVFSENPEWQEYSHLFKPDEQLLKASESGCLECNGGYAGRVILNEIIPINNDRVGENIIKDVKDNFVKSTLKDDALGKVRSWDTTIEVVQSILMK